MKAIHNDSCFMLFKTILCLIHQRYKMKAIHNEFLSIKYSDSTVFNTSKIQNESNSQQSNYLIKYSINCV